MSTIIAGIEVQENYNNILYNVMNTINLTVSSMEDMHQVLNRGIDTSSLIEAKGEINQISGALNHLNAIAENSSSLAVIDVGGAAESIQNNVKKQSMFNQLLQAGTEPAQALGKGFDKLKEKYMNLENLKKVLDLSDTMTKNAIQINSMNDGFHSTKDLQDTIFQSAQKSGTSYMAMTDTVLQLGQGTKGVFGTNEETIQFAENLNKSFLIAGASQEEVSSATAEMTQALASGTVSGEALNSIFGSTPGVVEAIAGNLGLTTEELMQMASAGELSSLELKEAMLKSTAEINTAAEGIPDTWGQVGQSVRDNALLAFQPILEKINNIANSPGFQTLVSNVMQATGVLANIIMNVFDLIGQVGSFIADNWSIISPLVYGVLAAFAAYVVFLAIVKAMELASAAMKTVLAIATLLSAAASRKQSVETLKAASAQVGLNAALLACPITLIVLGLILIIAVIFSAANAVAKLTGCASSGFGVIGGCINVTIQFFKNLALSVANIAIGIGSAIGALGENIMTAFYNAICSVKSWWYDLLATALKVIAKICEALNQLPFVEFDYSGIESKADEYARKSLEEQQNKREYTDISNAFDKGNTTYETFQEGWNTDAFEKGAEYGDKLGDKISNFSFTDMLGGANLPGEGILNDDLHGEDAYNMLEGQNTATGNFEDSTVPEDVGTIADNSVEMQDSLDITEEDLQYLRDLAETEVINRYTVAEVTIDQTNNNNVATGMDLDGVLSGLTDAMNEAVEIITEGVHT